MTDVTTSQPWIAVGELADSFAPGAHTFPAVDDLTDKHFSFYDADGGILRVSVEGASARVVSVGGDDVAGTCLVTSPRPGIYLVDIQVAATPRQSLVLVLDLERAAATIVEAKLPEPAAVEEPLFRRARRGVSLTSVTGTMTAASIDRLFDPTQMQPPTRDLVGMRVRHRYNDAELYEHLYLNERRYCWHCLEGSERGLADVDECGFRKIADGLYLFTWREKLIPTFGLVLMDLDALRTTGKIMGFKDDTFETVTHFPVGAQSQIVNRVPPEAASF